MSTFEFLFSPQKADHNNIQLFSDPRYIMQQLETLRDLRRTVLVWKKDKEREYEIIIDEIFSTTDDFFFSISFGSEKAPEIAVGDQLLFEYRFERIPFGFTSLAHEHEGKLLFVFPQTLYRLQRRRHERISLSISDNITISYKNRKGENVSRPVVNLALGGLGFLSEHDFDAMLHVTDDDDDSEVLFSFFLTFDEEEPFYIIGEYLYDIPCEDVDFAHYIGVRFHTVDAKAQEVLSDFISSRQKFSLPQ